MTHEASIVPPRDWRDAATRGAVLAPLVDWVVFDLRGADAVDLVNRGENAVREITMAKLIGGETACRVADRCVQLHGGAGYMHEFEVSRAWRDTRLFIAAESRQST